MKIKHFYYCVLYLFHIKALGKLSSMEANQLSRSMRSRNIYSIRTKLTTSWVRHVTESRYNLISLRALHGEGFNLSSEGDLIEIFKDTHVKFQAKRVSNVYMLRNSKVTVGGLQLSSASISEIVKQSETMTFSTSDIQSYLEGRLRLSGAGAQQESPDRYSYSGANFHKSWVDQEDRWVIKFRSGLNLFDLIKLWTPWGGYGEEWVRWRWSQ